MSRVINSNVVKAMEKNGMLDDIRRQVKKNLGLTLEQYRFLDSQIHEAMRKPLTGRKLISIRKIEGGLGKQQFSYDTLSHMSTAQLASLFTNEVDLPDLSRTNVHLPILQKGYEINPRNLMAAADSGMPMNTLAAESASKQLAEWENEYILQGYSIDNGTTYPITGLYQGAGLDESTNLDWGTAANIPTSINNTLALLNAQNFFGPFNLTLNSVQYNQARVLIGSTDRSYLQWIKDQIGGEIRIDPDITAGTGLMSAVAGTPTSQTNGGLGGAYAEYVMPVDTTHEEEILEKSHNLFGRVYSVGRVVIYDSNGLCKMSVI